MDDYNEAAGEGIFWAGIIALLLVAAAFYWWPT